MSAAVAQLPRRADSAQPRLTGVMAYVTDPESEAVLKRVAGQLAVPGFDLRRGDARLAERDLKTQRSPAVLFVDAADVDSVVETVARLSEVCEPQIQVVVIGARNDVGLYRDLLGMGVADYLFKPLTGDLVERVLNRLLTGEGGAVATTRKGKLVVVSGARGGAGASTVAANVASYLADKAERRVALVDLDLRTGAQALLVGAQPNAGLAEALESPSRIDDLFVERATIEVGPRLALLASELPLQRSLEISVEACGTLIERLRRSYFYVVVDMPRSLGAAGTALATAANLRLVVTEATLIGARDAARGFKAGIGQRMIIVHNKAGRPGDLAQADFLAALQRTPEAQVPYNPRAFGSALNLGQPAWRSGGAIDAAFGRLARELSGQGNAPVNRSWLDRVLGR